MKRIIKNIIIQLTGKPRILFLVDSVGALLTTLSLFVVLRTFHESIGMPVSVLTYLSILSVFFCLYSVACFLFLKRHRVPFIWIIGIANLLYCVLTITLVLVYYPQLTALGVAYFLGEIMIVGILVFIELEVAKAIKK
ncbi:hypothetical protein [Aquiflexum gelatinilyticum]|uniref:hypothetical protein n=1 Tax=Aquiflexum gelatinilyticum TaxID=2961943 RepID=UPI0021691D31|nr:hypothetical protein [Aquiflexum gelatinilyticum]MCS4435181.1 hypothetical protein [Aquiflexum gelatinilyticum]